MELPRFQFEISVIERADPHGYAPEITQVEASEEETIFRRLTVLEKYPKEAEAVQAGKEWLRRHVAKKYGPDEKYALRVFSESGFLNKVRGYLANEEPRRLVEAVDP